jgi:hypothetical protein
MDNLEEFTGVACLDPKWCLNLSFLRVVSYVFGILNFPKFFLENCDVLVEVSSSANQRSLVVEHGLGA